MMRSIRFNSSSMIMYQVFVGGVLGLILGIVYAVGGLILDGMVSLDWLTFMGTPGLSVGTIYAFGALIGMPIIFGLLGLMVGILDVSFFNIYLKVLKRFEEKR